jgi:Arc/MetJ-type ribon-helix-helix transcriptional regulator
MSLIPRLYRVTKWNDAKVKRLAKKKGQYASESDVVRQAISALPE